MITLKAIVPRTKNISYELLTKAVDKALLIAEEDLRHEFEKTIATWVRRPRFGVVWNRSKLSFHYGFTMQPTGRYADVYNWVDAGTAPHLITPVNSPYLVFMQNTRPKTRPGYITSYKGYRGKPWTRRLAVSHPGIRSRNFSTTIAKRYDPKFAKIAQNTITEATKEMEE